MKNTKSFIKRLLAFALVVMVTVTAVPTSQIWATEVDAQTEGQVSDEMDGTIVDGETDVVVEDEETDVVVEDGETDVVVEDEETDVVVEDEETDVVVTDGEEDDVVTDGEDDDVVTDEEDDDVVTDEETDDVVTEEGSDRIDNDGPVIEGLTFVENGQTVEFSDELHFVVKGYDAATTISYMTVWINSPTEMGSIIWSPSVMLKATGNENEYAGTLPSTNWSAREGSFKISQVTVYDENNLPTTQQVEGWSFTINPIDVNEAVNITFDKTEIIWTDEKTEDAITATVDVGTNTNIEYVILEFDPLATSYKDTLNVYIYIDPETGKGTREISPSKSQYNLVEGVYKLDAVRVYYKDGSSGALSIVPDLSYTFKNQMTDKKGPEILSVTIDKNGQVLTDGTIKVTITAKDATGYSVSGGISFRAPALDTGVYPTAQKSFSVEHKGNGVYEAEIAVAEFEGYEWTLASIWLYDSYGYSSTEQNWADGLGYFYVVKDGNFIDKMYKNVTVRLISNNQLVAEVTKDLYRRTTIEDIFGTAYVEPQDADAGKFLGWKYNSGYGNNSNLYTKDSEIVINNDNAIVTIYAVYEKTLCGISTTVLNNELETVYDYTEKYITPETTYADILKDIPNPTAPKGYTFTGWAGVTDEMMSQPVSSSNVSLIAKYDKIPVQIQKTYIDANGNLVTDKKIVDYPAGTKVGDVHKAVLAEKPAGATGWTYYSYLDNSSNEELTITYSRNFIYMAEYADKNIVKVDYSYYANDGKYGKYTNDTIYMILDNAACDTESEVKDAALAKVSSVVNDVYSKITLKSWLVPAYMGAYQDYDADGYYDYISVTANYEPFNAVYLIDLPGKDGGYEDTYMFVLNPGEKMTLPNNFNGWSIKWEDADGAEVGYSYTMPANEDGSEYFTRPLFAIKTGKYVENTPVYIPIVTPATPSTESSKTETATTTKKPATETKVEEVVETKPVVKIEEKKIEAIKEEITKALEAAVENADGATAEEPVKVVIDMKNEDGTVATVVPKDILEVAKGKNVEVVLDMGEYSWTINGNDIKASNLEDINLEVTFDQDVIPSKTIQALAQGNPTRQLSLTHNGDFGFTANLTINVDKENEGKFGNLFYYDSKGEMRFMNAGKIDADGNVSLEFSHASEYVVVIGDDMTAEYEAAEEDAVVEGGVVDDTATEEATEDGSSLPIILVVVIVAVIAVVVFMKKKN